MGNQDVAAQEDDYVSSPNSPRFDSLHYDKVPGDEPRAHASANNAQNEMAAFACSMKKLNRVEILRAGNQCVGSWLRSTAKSIGGLSFVPELKIVVDWANVTLRRVGGRVDQ